MRAPSQTSASNLIALRWILGASRYSRSRPDYSSQPEQYPTYLCQLSVQSLECLCGDVAHVLRKDEAIFTFFCRAKRDIEVPGEFEFRPLAAALRDVRRNGRDCPLKLVPDVSRHDSAQFQDGSMDVEGQRVRLLPGD